MKLKPLMLFLFALCAQNAGATDKTRKKNGRIKKIVGALLLNHLALNAPTTQTNALCQATLPPYATDMMQYIYCAENEETADPFDKYLETQGEEYCSPFKLKLQNLYEKVKSLGKCPEEKYTDIAHGAKERIVGKTPDRNTELEMFQEYLLNVEGVYNAEKLSEKFEGLDKPDFFQFKSVLDLHKRKIPDLDNSFMVEHSLDMLQHHYKNLNFDQLFHRLISMPYLKNKSATNQIQLATDQKKQDNDLDRDEKEALKELERNGKVLEVLKEFYPDDPDNGKSNLSSLKHHYKDLNFEQVHRLMPFLKNKRPKYQIEVATDPKYQDYNLDRNEKVLEILKEFSPDDPENEKKALELWIQHKDLSTEKIDEIYKKCKTLKNQREPFCLFPCQWFRFFKCWKLNTEVFKKSDL